jgi:tRNA (guanine-N7-)-methyltransferase
MNPPRTRVFYRNALDDGAPLGGETPGRSDATIFWQLLFQNDHPNEMEIGCGVGSFLLPTAAAHPERNYFGIERAPTLAAVAEHAIARARLSNVRVLCADAQCVVASLIPAASVVAYHIYFPDPWWKRRHHRRRLFSRGFVAALARTLAPGGEVHLATDVAELFAQAQAATVAAGLTRLALAPAPPMTVFARRCLGTARTLHHGSFRR